MLENIINKLGRWLSGSRRSLARSYYPTHESLDPVLTPVTDTAATSVETQTGTAEPSVDSQPTASETGQTRASDRTYKPKVFSSVPTYNRKRIFGTENEYGTIWTSGQTANFRQIYSRFKSNGGLLYYDCGHIEYASPETSNPLEAVIFEKAGELLSLPYAEKLYKNNEDSEGHSFGAHENYFTFAKNITSILPFLVTRQIFAGAGILRPNEGFSISQKANYINFALGGDTTNNRAILCTKNEAHADVRGWYRLHLILGDANMCEVADFLKLGTTGLVVDLAEDDKLPNLSYALELNDDQMRFKRDPVAAGLRAVSNPAVRDIKTIARSTNNWKVTGLEQGSMQATDVQRAYLDAAVAAYAGRDKITDALLSRWSFTLDALDRNPMELVGSIDWVTKKALIDAYAQQHNLSFDDPVLRNIDLQYHDLDRQTSLFYTLQNAGKIERITTDKLIEKAMHNPPRDTRANSRSYALEHGADVNWPYITIKSGDGEEKTVSMPDPFNQYKAEIARALK